VTPKRNPSRYVTIGRGGPPDFFPPCATSRISLRGLACPQNLKRVVTLASVSLSERVDEVHGVSAGKPESSRVCLCGSQHTKHLSTCGKRVTCGLSPHLARTHLRRSGLADGIICAERREDGEEALVKRLFSETPARRTTQSARQFSGVRSTKGYLWRLHGS
jgi:hypothetical protein